MTIVRTVLFGAGVAICGAVVGAQAPAGVGQPPAGPPPMRVQPIREGRVYWVSGGGGNSGVVIGDNGVVVIDAKITEGAAKEMLAAIGTITPKPVTHVILTHSDGDHVNGLAGFPAGVAIIAHVNNRNEQRATFLNAAVEVDGGRCLPPADRLPTQVVTAGRVVTRIHGVNFALLHLGPAHTSGDLVVQLPDDRVAFTGDLITNNVLVHAEKAGSLDGWFTSARGLLALDVDSYVGGHAAALDTKVSLQKRVGDYQAQRDRVLALMKEGKTLAEVKAAAGDPPKNASGCRGIPYLSFAEVSFHSQNDKVQEVK
jgi:glyoxylase-like metal-dependent hydrolase (beta-lactamase superfamily II)